MIIWWGTVRLGKVDHVPGVFYVNTQFFHFQGLPFLPLSSMVVVDGTETRDGQQGIAIGISPKSVLIAWLRFVTMFACVASLVMGLVMLSAPDLRQRLSHYVVFAFALSAVTAGVFWLSYILCRPSLQRQIWLAQQLKLTPEEYANLVASQMTEEQLQQLRDQWDQQNSLDNELQS